MYVDDMFEIGICLQGVIDNYVSTEALIQELKQVIDEYLTWNLDGDINFYVTEV